MKYWSSSGKHRVPIPEPVDTKARARTLFFGKKFWETLVDAQIALSENPAPKIEQGWASACIVRLKRLGR